LEKCLNADRIVQRIAGRLHPSQARLRVPPPPPLRVFTVLRCACRAAGRILWTLFTQWQPPGGNMRQDDIDADDTFSDLLNGVALVTLFLITLVGGWYFS
jgi:hypothetical protein